MPPDPRIVPEPRPSLEHPPEPASWPTTGSWDEAATPVGGSCHGQGPRWGSLWGPGEGHPGGTDECRHPDDGGRDFAAGAQCGRRPIPAGELLGDERPGAGWWVAITRTLDDLADSVHTTPGDLIDPEGFTEQLRADAPHLIGRWLRLPGAASSDRGIRGAPPGRTRRRGPGRGRDRRARSAPCWPRTAGPRNAPATCSSRPPTRPRRRLADPPPAHWTQQVADRRWVGRWWCPAAGSAAGGRLSSCPRGPAGREMSTMVSESDPGPASDAPRRRWRWW